ncbi:hypothetical protein PHMEG_00035356 [Phytophthora megakarya]|uniref:CCHC-type domain-containing protein n=1 Tax=Phytophthora megakarya TaxID=4795 RepID=A0A225UPC2_9STRA|nr:hypothetical protein PHMEG_00035356 [Phytophthora megakarya]
MRLKLYLEQRDSWGVVTVAEMRHGMDPVQQGHFDDRNRLAMETIIRGVKGADAQKVCIFSTAKEMWDTLIAEKTQRDFSYAVHLKREMYTHAYVPGQKMSDYIQEMNALRQRLQHMGPNFVVDDTSMSQLLLMDEMDKMAADTAVGSSAMSGGASVAMHMGQQQGQHLGQNIGQAPKSGPQGQVPATGAGKKRAIRCYHSKKLGHMRKDCWYYKSKQNKAQGKKEKSQSKEKKGGTGSSATSEPGKTGMKQATGAMGYMRFTTAAENSEDSSSSSSDVEPSFVGMVADAKRHGHHGDWMLDSGS